MKNAIFEKLKMEFNAEGHDTLKLYCDTIWDVYEKTTPRHLEPTIEYFLERAKKASRMIIGEKEVLFFNYFDSIHDRLKLILKTTHKDNIKDEDGLLYIIDSDKIYPFEENKEEGFAVFILEEPIIFRRVYEYFSNTIHKK